jgi:broad specificity phosphatase PhoE
MSAVTLPLPIDSAVAATGTTTILVVRHTEVHNPQRVLYGRLPDYRLSDYGVKQAERLAEFLAQRPISVVYSSPLERARQVASLIADRHPDAQRMVTGLLNEIGTSWEGTPFSQFKPGFSAYENRRHDDDESIEDVQRRMTEFVTRARAKHPGETLVGVSHGDPITILRIALSGRPVTVALTKGSDYAGIGSITEITFAPEATTPQVRVVRY